ncbi:hypothetical protein M8818_000317 [Zalaria obscura]|uniref:Uncharacterized protein n=1 Tax=Zalaria obscura TaxID=2024903 RepID=A0ACC3SPJ4_9PEZI
MGNGAKAQQKRERNAKDAGGKAKSQLKDNVAAMNKVSTYERAIESLPLMRTEPEMRHLHADFPVHHQQEGQSLNSSQDHSVQHSNRGGPQALDEHASNRHNKTGQECFGEAYEQYVSYFVPVPIRLTAYANTTIGPSRRCHRIVETIWHSSRVLGLHLDMIPHHDSSIEFPTNLVSAHCRLHVCRTVSPNLR